MQIITNNKEKINLNRLPIYDKADMIKVYEARYKKKPANDNELLDGLNSDDIDNMNKRYSLVSFLQRKIILKQVIAFIWMICHITKFICKVVVQMVSISTIYFIKKNLVVYVKNRL